MLEALDQTVFSLVGVLGFVNSQVSRLVDTVGLPMVLPSILVKVSIAVKRHHDHVNAYKEQHFIGNSLQI